jgi:hypothetical protein
MAKQARVHKRVKVLRAEYYLPEADVADRRTGIVDMRAEWLDVDHEISDGQVTIGARGDNGGDGLSYELDLTPRAARELALMLLEAADAAEGIGDQRAPAYRVRSTVAKDRYN